METLRVKNFKCFVHQDVQLQDLTVMVGANGMGKSTVMQSLLLLRQCKESLSELIPLNGPYALALGTYDSIISRYADGKISFQLIGHDGNDIYSVSFDGKNEEESFAMKKEEIVSPNEAEGIMAPTFYFLSAERNGPRICQRIVEQDYLNCGIYGEYTGQVLSYMNYSTKVCEELCHNAKPSPILRDQVNAWLNEILPGNEVTAEAVMKMQTVQVQLKNGVSGDYVESTNLGFGITYCLPIIVTGLIAQKGSYFIVENPEAHLHPAAQTAMGKFLAQVANSRVKVIVETHSDHILDGIQIYVAQHPNMCNKVVINNFGIGENGMINVIPITYTDTIEYSTWPNGFMDATSINYAEFIKLRG